MVNIHNFTAPLKCSWIKSKLSVSSHGWIFLKQSMAMIFKKDLSILVMFFYKTSFKETIYFWLMFLILKCFFNEKMNQRLCNTKYILILVYGIILASELEGSMFLELREYFYASITQKVIMI